MSALAVFLVSPVAYGFGPKPTPPPVYTGIPVILAPGLLIPLKSYEDATIKSIFTSKGYELVVAQQKDSGSVESRADKLCSEIARLVPTGPFHIMAISMGGLDARRAIQKCGLGDRVMSLTTVATPHRGTPLADSVAKDEPSSGLFKDLGDALKDLRTKECAAFNDRVLDDERVKYYSIGFMIPEPVTLQNTDFLTWYLHLSIKNKSGEDNDGLVGVGSAEWGTYLGTMEGNHLAISVANQEYRGQKIYQATYQAVVDNLVAVDAGR